MYSWKVNLLISRINSSPSWPCRCTRFSCFSWKPQRWQFNNQNLKTVAASPPAIRVCVLLLVCLLLGPLDAIVTLNLGTFRLRKLFLLINWISVIKFKFPFRTIVLFVPPPLCMKSHPLSGDHRIMILFPDVSLSATVQEQFAVIWFCYILWLTMQDVCHERVGVVV